MKIFARVVFVFALLCGLAYGSFAFGKYVLSNKLFGDGTGGGALRTVSRSTTQANAVTHHTDWKGNKPRVEVRMLPADEAGPAPQASALADEDNLSTERRSDDDDSTARSTASRAKIKERNLDDAPIEYSLGDDNEGRSRRRRHRKSKEEKEKPKPTATPAPVDAATISTPGAANGDQADSTSSSDAAEPSISSAPPASETRRPAATPSTPRRARVRTRRARETGKPRVESPVPQPESAGASGAKSGGDSAQISPVPQPG
jgi:hypothetical protein